MGRRVIRSWFLAHVKYHAEHKYIVYADTRSQVKECFGDRVEIIDIQQLNWQEISRLTGCVIHSHFDANVNATGDLMFRHRDGAFVLTGYESGV